MVSAEDLVNIYQLLVSRGIKTWVLGGWGIDVLLGEQTRPHKDLDLIVQLDDVFLMDALLVRNGYKLKEIWSENEWANDKKGLQTLTAFVLSDTEGRELDFHAIRLDEQGNGIPAWEAEEGFTFTKEDLSGEGVVDEISIRCITAQKQMLCHSGYELPEKQVPDLMLLHDRFGVDYPASLAKSDAVGKLGSG